MPTWSARRRPGRTLGLLLLVILSFLVLRRWSWRGLVPTWLRHRHSGLQAKGQNFMLEDSTFWIFGGSIHYFRVPREYWRDRLLKLRACGLNTLTTYVPWNLHEPERGKFDFSGNLDLEAFVLLAAEVGLWVILRPGPYVCSELDLGGLPSWLLQDSGMRLRTTYKGFTDAVDLYFDHLMSRVVPLQYRYGGPVIAVQVENEYGSYNRDPAYMPYVKRERQADLSDPSQALEDRGIVELLLTSDNKDGLSKGVMDGVLATINLQSQSELQLLVTYLLSVQRGCLMGEEDLRYRASDTSISPNASLVLWRFCERGCAELVPGVISVSLGQSCAKSGSGSNTRLWTVLRGIVVASVQPKMVMEYWTGWFDSWGGPHNILDSSEVLKTVSAIVDAGSSINLYMFHGGTNFGFMNGALHFQDYKSDVTSYGKCPQLGPFLCTQLYYDAVLTEAGDYTAKYVKLREFFGSVSGAPLPLPPDLLPKTAYEAVKPVFCLSLWDVLPYLEEAVGREVRSRTTELNCVMRSQVEEVFLLPSRPCHQRANPGSGGCLLPATPGRRGPARLFSMQPVSSEKPVNMENLPINDGNGQSFGYTLYETTITSSGILSGLVRDRGQVFVNTVSVGFLDYKRKEVAIPLIQGFILLRILVENCGRVNYGDNINDQRKGLIGDLYLNDSPLRGFKIYSLEMKKGFFKSFLGDKWNPVPDVPTFPAFFLGVLSVPLSPYDTFMKLEGWEKGVVFVNGQNLGRYWNVGPQETLYLPGVWLAEGINQVIVFEEKMAGPMIQFTETPHLGRRQYVD
ncbi:Beta-galactosidase-1-like protein 2 [Camelus dromedarius]|uniref:Beta-galactosidase n=1 Tax=Camelus dromedarius TaxID=9838 RepID=A0A5N4C7N8_CAMDR|nr:Beta-galactosidase-1-like protein 2 [Camelus dromedarius]